MSFRGVALDALARSLPDGALADTPALEGLGEHRDAPLRSLGALTAALRSPAPEDAALAALAGALGITPIEVLAVALAVAVEDDVMLGRALAHLQSPIGTSRPTLGLLAAAFTEFVAPGAKPMDLLAFGVAVQSGLLVVAGDPNPLPERWVSVPLPIAFALGGLPGVLPGTSTGVAPDAVVPLPPSVLATARRHAQAMASSRRTLVIRTGSPNEGRAAAAAVARELGQEAAFIEGDRVAGLTPWLLLRRLVPVFVFELGPGERKLVPPLPYYEGPLVAVTGPEGAVATVSGTAMSWSIGVPAADEREALWVQALGDPPLARTLAGDHRHGSGRIAHLGRLAQHRSAVEGRAQPTADDVTAASWIGEGAGLDGLAQPLTATIPDEALVIPQALRVELEHLLLRCRSRERLVQGLGPSSTARYMPGVRALFVGPSGTGKTLAAGWLATRLGLPLFRVDLASVTSKYIGETEKNLAQLLARSEHAEVVLLFDEADSIFGKRTDIKDSNDRFANSQTNYLLQRIETFEGIALLTSNSQSRFDSAFTRRLDVVLEFTSPGPLERRAIWESHLGAGHSLSTRQIDQLAALADVEGGQIRNAVLTAAVYAQAEHRPIAHGDVLRGLASEYKKSGWQVPHQLRG